MPENQAAKKFRGLLVAVIAATVGWGATAQAQVVKGSGTAGTIPVWSGNSTIGNSMVSQGGGTLNIAGAVKATGAISASSFAGSFSGDGSGLTNVNAAEMGGFSSSAFAQVGAQNTFATTQTIDGNLSLTGSINNTLTLQGDVTSNTETSANVIGGFGGNDTITGNSVAGGVVGATVAGGGGALGGSLSVPNTVTVSWGTIGGGAGNIAGGRFAVVGGGLNNTANGYIGAAVGGGENNTASGMASTVCGGNGNVASGENATVAGGRLNIAAGYSSFAAGQGAEAQSDGSFVWNDRLGQQLTDFGPNTFSARASGGFAFYTGTSSGAYLPAGSGSWSSLSDRNVKANLAMVDGHAILERLASLPIATWNYKSQSDSVRHMGPMAQDFREAFGLGEDERHISTVDSEGVALAAIQALYQLSQQQVHELSRQVNELQNQVARLNSSR